MSDIRSLHRQFCLHSETFKGNTKRGVAWLHQCFERLLAYREIDAVEDIDRPLIEGWLLHGKRDHQWKAKTIRNYLNAVSLFLDWCVAEGHIATNPAKGIPRPRLPRRLPRSLSLDDASLIYACARNAPYPTLFQKTRAVAIIACFLYTGIRLKELYGLELSHVDLNAATLFVAGGKGDKDRLIPMPPQLIKPLKAFVVERNRMKHRCPTFFTSVQGDQRMGGDVVKRLVSKLREVSGVYFSPHMLRHTCATLLLQSGSDLLSIQEILGHADIATTRIYLSVTTDHVRTQIAKHPIGG